MYSVHVFRTSLIIYIRFENTFLVWLDYYLKFTDLDTMHNFVCIMQLKAVV